MTSHGAESASYVEVWRPQGVEVVLLTGQAVTVGRADDSGIVLDHDTQVSSLHAVLQAYGNEWAIRDLGSTNGTVVAGERLLAERALRHGDSILIGRTRLVYRGDASGRAAPTMAPRRPPELTRRERDVLAALCRPLFSGEVFTEPATARDIAAVLVVTEAAIKQHLLRLYDKFELDPRSTRRRVELANQALQRGAVNPAELASGHGRSGADDDPTS